jgi:hypothetical protein
MLGLIGLSPVIAGFLHLTSDVPVVMLATMVPPTAVAAVAQGALIGRFRFTTVGVGLLVGATARLLFGVILVEAGLGVSGAMLAGTLGALVTMGIVLWPLRSAIRVRSEGSVPLLARGEGRSALVAISGFWALAGVDTFLVRHLMAARPAGLYAAAATGSRIALFAPAAYVVLVFPRFAANRGRGPEARRLLGFSLGLVTLMGAIFGGAIVALRGSLVHILFGSSFTGSAGVVGILAMEASLLGVIGLLTYFHLARGSAFAQLGWFGTAVAVVGIALAHRSLDQVAAVMLATSLGVLFLSLAGVFAPRQSDARAPVRDGFKDIGPDACDLTIIIPFFNPGPRFGPHLADVVGVLESTGRTFEVIAVSDGCTDGSQMELVVLGLSKVRLIALPSNRGKGAALRFGMAEARGTYVGFIDADGDIPARMIPALVALTDGDRPDMVLGSKHHPDSEVVYPPLRRIYSMGYQLLVALLFRLPVRDTQTGLKLIRREAMAAVVPRMVEKRFAFDLELLVVARHLGYRRFVEAPVVIGHRFSSTVSPRAVRGMIQDTFAIFYRLRIRRAYDRPPTHPSRLSGLGGYHYGVGTSRSPGRFTSTVVPLGVPQPVPELHLEEASL